MSKKNEVQIRGAIEAMRNDFSGITNFISAEFVKIAQANGGTIDVNNPSFASAAQSLIYADPDAPENKGKAVLSFTATKKGILDKIDNLINNGADSKLFVSIKEDLATLESQLKEQISTTKGIQALVSNKLSEDLVKDSNPLFVKFAEEDFRGMPKEQVDIVMPQIAKNITLPESIIQAMLTSNTIFSDAMIDTTRQIMSESLGTKEGHVSVLDESKLNPENFANVGQKISTAATSMVKLVRGTVAQMREEGEKISPQLEQKMLETMIPTVSQFEQGYIKENKTQIMDSISQSITAQRTVFSRIISFITNRFNISDASLTKASTVFAAKQSTHHEKHISNKIDEAIYKNQLTDSQIAKNLNSFSKITGQDKTFDKTNLPSNQELYEMRKANPKAFDQIVLTKTKRPLPPIPVTLKKTLERQMEPTSKETSVVVKNAKEPSTGQGR